jgi:hypothetical protein
MKDPIEYKDYPEGSGLKRYYDSVYLPFTDYLKKYYSNPDISTFELWQKKYIDIAFNKSNYKDLVKAFGYRSIDKHNFEEQHSIYEQIKKDERLDEETKRFIGFMAGNNFFQKHNIGINDWFNMKNWTNPYKEINEGKTIDEILSFDYGLNYLKTILPQLDHWRR